MTDIKRVLQLNPSPPDSRDFKVSISTTQTMAPCVDISSRCTGIKDQGTMGSCTAFASVACLESIIKKFGESKTGGLDSQDDMLSERFTYYTTRVDVLKWAAEDSGAYIRDALKSLVKYGSCLEKTMPYNNDYSTRPTESAYKEAANYQAIMYARFEDGMNPTERKVLINNLKANLSAGFPIVCGFICYSNIWTAVNGLIPRRDNTPVGGHAILLVGYDDQRQVFKFKNSWGVGWGDKGYGYLPYDFYYQGDMFDIWSVYKTELNGKIVGIDIRDPMLRKKILKTDLDELFASIVENLDKILQPAELIVYFNNLYEQYKSKPHLRTFINTMKIQMTRLAVAE